MSSVIIYSDENNTLLKDMCERASDAEVKVLHTSGIKDMEAQKASIAVINMPLDKLKDLSMIMKFPIPVLFVCDKKLDEYYERIKYHQNQVAANQEMKSHFEERISEATKRIQELEEYEREMNRQKADYYSLSDRLAECDNTDALTRGHVNSLIDRITVNSETDIEIRFTFDSGFDLLREAIDDA